MPYSTRSIDSGYHGSRRPTNSMVTMSPTETEKDEAAGDGDGSKVVVFDYYDAASNSSDEASSLDLWATCPGTPPHLREFLDVVAVQQPTAPPTKRRARRSRRKVRRGPAQVYELSTAIGSCCSIASSSGTTRCAETPRPEPARRNNGGRRVPSSAAATMSSLPRAEATTSTMVGPDAGEQASTEDLVLRVYIYFQWLLSAVAQQQESYEACAEAAECAAADCSPSSSSSSVCCESCGSLADSERTSSSSNVSTSSARGEDSLPMAMFYSALAANAREYLAFLESAYLQSFAGNASGLRLDAQSTAAATAATTSMPMTEEVRRIMRSLSENQAHIASMMTSEQFLWTNLYCHGNQRGTNGSAYAGIPSQAYYMSPPPLVATTTSSKSRHPSTASSTQGSSSTNINVGSLTSTSMNQSYQNRTSASSSVGSRDQLPPLQPQPQSSAPSSCAKQSPESSSPISHTRERYSAVLRRGNSDVDRDRQQKPVVKSKSVELKPPAEKTAEGTLGSEFVANGLPTSLLRGVQANDDVPKESSTNLPPQPPPASILSASGQFQVSKMDVLSENVWHYHNKMTQTDTTLNRKLHLRDMLYFSIARVFPMCGLYVVGSSLNGFGNNSSDMDLCLMITNKELDQRTEAVVVLNMILVTLQSEKFVANQQLILAKVPILRIRFDSPFEDITVDLNANNAVAIKNTHLLCYYSSFDWRVRPIVTVVKEWAKRKGINDANRSSFTSYSLVLMVIHYLQCGAEPPVLPNLQKVYSTRFSNKCDVRTLNVTLPLNPPPENTGWKFNESATLGELLIGFLNYYAKEFNYDRDAISIRQGRRVERAQVARQQRAGHNGFSSSPSSSSAMLNGGTPSQAAWRSQWRCICIEEPFTNSNTAHSIYDEMVFGAIKSAFHEAHKELEANRDLNRLLACKPINVATPVGGAVVYAAAYEERQAKAGPTSTPTAPPALAGSMQNMRPQFHHNQHQHHQQQHNSHRQGARAYSPPFEQLTQMTSQKLEMFSAGEMSNSPATFSVATAVSTASSVSLTKTDVKSLPSSAATSPSSSMLSPSSSPEVPNNTSSTMPPTSPVNQQSAGKRPQRAKSPTTFAAAAAVQSDHLPQNGVARGHKTGKEPRKSS